MCQEAGDGLHDRLSKAYGHCRHTLAMCWFRSILSETVSQPLQQSIRELKALTWSSGHLHRRSAGFVSREESAGDPAPRLCCRRIGVLQHERLQRKPMRHHIWRVGRRENGSCEADNAIHRQRIWGNRLLDPANQRYGVSYQPFVGIVRQCKDAQE